MKNITIKTIILLSILFATVNLSIAQWTQIGSDIDGEDSLDYSGSSVSLSSDGSIMAVGAPYNDGNGSNSGHVRIFEDVAGNWVQIGSDIDGEADNDHFGTSVSLNSDGSILAIGAPGIDAGHVSVYEYSGGVWTQLGTDIYGEATGDHSGQTVCLNSDGTIVAIGAENNAGFGGNKGHVRVYEYSGGTWIQMGNDIDGEAESESFGKSVSLSDNGLILAIGDYRNSGGGISAGHARIYEFSGGNWIQLGIDIDGDASSETGNSVCLSSNGQIVAIGAPAYDGISLNAGLVRIYEYSGGNWIQVGNDINGEAQGDELGYSVSLSSDGTIVAAGAYYNDGNGTSAGHVRVYEYSGGTWTQVGNDIDGEAADDFSGRPVSLNSFGNIVAIGAYGNDGNGNEAGHVRVYMKQGCGTVTDYDGNVYNTVSIGNQCWTKENIRTTHYSDGTPITKGSIIHGDASWGTDQAWYSCPPNSTNDGEDCAAAASLGMVYQWSAAMNGSTIEGAQGICPDGWHVPTDVELKTLEGFLGMTVAQQNATGWRGTNEGSKMANNVADQNWTIGVLTGDVDFSVSGFDLGPSGYRFTNGSYNTRSTYTNLWSSTGNGTNAWNRFFSYDRTDVNRDEYNKANGFSVRCIKNPLDTCLGFTIDTLNIQDATCGLDNGTAEVIVSGGTSPFTYNWSNGDTLDIADTLSAGMHSIQVVDSLGCYAMEYFIINSTGGPIIIVDNVVNVTCYGGNNGLINLTTTGSIESYVWSNSATTEDITNLTAGNYQLMVTDFNGCMASFDTIIVQPPPLEVTFDIVNPSCLNSNGAITAYPTGGISPPFYSFNWSSGSTAQTASGLSAGTYTITITDDSLCTLIENIVLTTTGGGPVITLDSVIIAGCGGNDGAIYVSVTGGTTPYASYLWSEGTITEDLIDVNPGIYYLTVTDGAGCIAVFSEEIIGIEPLEQPICVVMVDSATAMNLVVWEKVQTTGIEHYNIYRESWYAGQYDFIDAVMYDDMSEYVDPTANPATRSWRYKISAEDACGNESPLSEHHKTIHLTINEGLGQTYNLIWDHYEGFPYFTYYIHRYMNATGWLLIDSLPANLTSYTDDPGTMGGLLYKISINTPNACIPTSTVKTNGGPYSHSVSNLEDNGIAVGIKSIINNIEAVIYPNPNTGNFIIESDFNINTIKIYDIVGELVYENKFRKEVNITNLTNGIYILKLFDKQNTALATFKVIKQ